MKILLCTALIFMCISIACWVMRMYENEPRRRSRRVYERAREYREQCQSKYKFDPKSYQRDLDQALQAEGSAYINLLIYDPNETSSGRMVYLVNLEEHGP